jgi:hypothetical protein
MCERQLNVAHCTTVLVVLADANTRVRAGKLIFCNTLLLKNGSKRCMESPRTLVVQTKKFTLCFATREILGQSQSIRAFNGSC